ncbi:MAG: hypothetical protein JXB26_16270 [Candidatus Aminicenantes bacterium]|nr:hypothetical protein [Candidatus Aminicenantes bacterium]
MKKFIVSTAVFCFFFLTFFSPIHAQWARTYGGSEDDYAYSIQETNDGGFIVTGEVLSFGEGLTEIWVIKLNAAGEITWQKSFGAGADDLVRLIRQTSDGGYITAGFTYSFAEELDDIWIIKLDAAGQSEWQKIYGGTNYDSAESINQTSDGGYIVAGGTVSYGAGEDDIWILKLDAAGNITWQKTYGSSDSDFAISALETTDKGFIVLASTQSYGAGDVDSWILKLSANGDIEWQKTYGGDDEDRLRSIKQTNDGGYITAGFTYSMGAGYDDAWILKLDNTGDIIWQRVFGGVDYDAAQSVHQTSDGGYIAAGGTVSYGAGEDDIWILKLDAAGNITWQKTYGGRYSDEAMDISQTSTGGYIIAGFTNSFGAGEDDFLILNLSPSGEIDSECPLMGSSEATITTPSMTPGSTNISPQETDAASNETTDEGIDTQATVFQLCPAQKISLIISSDSGGTTSPSPGTYTYVPSTVVTITAISDDDYLFDTWVGDFPDGDEYTNPLVLSMDADKAVTATFLEIEGNCFIATAAYGSPLHPHVKTMRDFRDKYLMSNKAGRAFVRLYYKYSSSLTGIISNHKLLKIGIRLYLAPLVLCGYSMLYLGPLLSTLLLVLLITAVVLTTHLIRKKSFRHISRKISTQ